MPQLINISIKDLAVFRKQSTIMKKIKFEKKLSLNKETVAKLNEKQMAAVKGGLPIKKGDPTNSYLMCWNNTLICY